MPPRLLAGAGLVAVAAAALTTTRAVRNLRAEARAVPPLDHDIDLPGRFPPRYLVVLGDSAAAGHGLPDPEAGMARRLGRALVAEDARATAVRSLARDGATTAEVVARQVARVADAEVVVIGVGVNDALHPATRWADLEDATHRLLQEVAARARTDAAIVLVTCPDLSAAPGLPLPVRPVVGLRCRRVAEVQRRVAAVHGIPTVDAPRDRLPPAMFGPDGFHPGADGHAVLAEGVLAVLTAQP